MSKPRFAVRKMAQKGGTARVRPWMVIVLENSGWQYVSFHSTEDLARAKAAALNDGSVHRRIDMKAFKVEVQADASRVWASNQLRFATQMEALEYGRDLFTRWGAVRAWRVAETAEIPTHRWDSRQGALPLAEDEKEAAS